MNDVTNVISAWHHYDVIISDVDKVRLCDVINGWHPRMTAHLMPQKDGTFPTSEVTDGWRHKTSSVCDLIVIYQWPHNSSDVWNSARWPHKTSECVTSLWPSKCSNGRRNNQWLSRSSVICDVAIVSMYDLTMDDVAMDDIMTRQCLKSQKFQRMSSLRHHHYTYRFRFFPVYTLIFDLHLSRFRENSNPNYSALIVQFRLIFFFFFVWFAFLRSL